MRKTAGYISRVVQVVDRVVRERYPGDVVEPALNEEPLCFPVPAQRE